MPPQSNECILRLLASLQLSITTKAMLLLPLLTPQPRPAQARRRAVSMGYASSGYPEFDYESAAALPKDKLRPPPPAAEVPSGLEAAMQGFDYSGASDDEVSSMAARLLEQLKREATELTSSPLTAALAQRDVLRHDSLGNVVADVLAGKICKSDQVGGGTDPNVQAQAMRETMADAFSTPRVLRGLVADLIKCYVVDPACDSLLQPVLFFKGFHAIQVYRVAHTLWRRGAGADQGAALLMQSRAAEVFSVDIHPAATIGNGVMLDHATGIVIGSTCILGDDIYMLHQVTLGATGRPTYGAKRHPSIGSGVTLGAGCTVLGDVTVNDGALVGASAIVTVDVPEKTTVVGVNKLVQRKDDDDDSADDYTWMYFSTTSERITFSESAI